MPATLHKSNKGLLNKWNMEPRKAVPNKPFVSEEENNFEVEN